MSGEGPIAAGVAGRYATALYELADEAKSLDKVAEDVRNIATLIKGNLDLSRLVMSPAFSRDEQGRAMDAVLARVGTSSITRKFVGLVAQKRRLPLLVNMIMIFAALLSFRRGEIAARVTSAHPLSAAQVNALKDSLRASFHREVQLETHVDQRLLGGLVVKVGSRMIDSSLASKLAKLKLAMKEA